MSKPIPIRFEAATVELLQFVSGPLLGEYATQADFIREAVEEKLERENVLEQYRAARLAVEETKANEALTELVVA